MNSIFKSKAPVSAEPIGGTEALRQNLAMKIRKRPLMTFVRDINESLAATSKRNAALAIAGRMAGEGADDTVVAGIAKSLLGNLPDTPSASVSETELANFVAGKDDLSPLIKSQLAALLYGNHIVFDDRIDRLVNMSPPGEVVAPAMTPPYTSPDPAIAKAQAAYHAALAVSPVLTAKLPTAQGNQQPSSLRRPGFA